MKIILAAILTAAIATPAAAHYSKKADHVTIKKVHRSGAAHAYAPKTWTYRSPNDVYVDGVYAGSDPDWHIRQSLRQQEIADHHW